MASTDQATNAAWIDLRSRSGAPRTGLLVSVRSADEARAALAGGADVIDVKEPSRGPLGRSDASVLAQVIAAVSDRAAVTAAMGELVDWTVSLGSQLPTGAEVLKFGLSGLRGADWSDRLLRIRASAGGETCVAPVVYADRAADAPGAFEVIDFAAKTDRWIVIDTWDKSSADSLTIVGESVLAGWIDRADRLGVRAVLAGGLSGSAVGVASRLGAALVGVRGAACRGERSGTIDTRRVAEIAIRVREAPRAGRSGMG